MASKKKSSTGKGHHKVRKGKKAVETKRRVTHRKAIYKQVCIDLTSYIIVIAVLLLGSALLILILFTGEGNIGETRIQSGFCGDGLCITPTEDCSTCPTDCGPCAGISDKYATVKVVIVDKVLSAISVELYDRQGNSLARKEGVSKEFVFDKITSDKVSVTVKSLSTGRAIYSPTKIITPGEQNTIPITLPPEFFIDKDYGTLRVTIKDKRTNKLPYGVETKIYLMRRSGLVSFPVELVEETVIDGIYTFNNLEAKKWYGISASKEGYADFEDGIRNPVYLTPGITKSVVILLEPLTNP